ncbi:unnamed protein product [Amoebophrya sp. A120]|nr:unnamed protein product [Amoebophrya sp. A120]|eukprot:GSA120T00009165001.1
MRIIQRPLGRKYLLRLLQELYLPLRTTSLSIRHHQVKAFRCSVGRCQNSRIKERAPRLFETRVDQINKKIKIFHSSKPGHYS